MTILTEEIVSLLHTSGERFITIAPEAGSDRLRRVVNKTVTNDEIRDRVEVVFANGIENLKLYLMIGLPTRRRGPRRHQRPHDADAGADARPCAQAGAHWPDRRERESAHPQARDRVPQWLPMEAPAVTDKKIKRLRALVANIDNVYFTIKSERHSYYQALLSLGNRRVAPVIEAAERNGGQWRAATAEAGVDADFYLFRDRSQDARLPSGHHRRWYEARLLPNGVREGPA